MADPQVNFFKSTLVGTYSDTDTSFTIATGDGALLPDPSVDGAFNLTIFEGLQVTGSTEFEIVRVTARSGDVLTVTRGQESTTPLTIGSATHSILMSATKKTFDDINDAIENVDLTTLTGVEELTFDSTGDEEFGLPAGTTAQRPSNPSAGYMRYNTDDSRPEIYNGSRWAGINLVGFQQADLGVAQLSVTANDALFEAVATFLGNRGLFAGGQDPNITNVIDYVAIDTTGNATDFGDLTDITRNASSCSNRTRGLFAGGNTGSTVNKIDYVTIATTGNAQDFGDLTIARWILASCSDGDYGLFGGGLASVAENTIDYVVIDTTGNATDFGDLTQARYGVSSCSDGSRGVFGGGFTGSVDVNTIDYVTIATTGNAVDFGDLSVTRSILGSCSNTTRGLFGGGDVSGSAQNVIDYITIQTTGNATDFGDLTSARDKLASCSNETRGLFGGGEPNTNLIDFVTIDTTGNATDFGDLTVSRRSLASTSGD